jgi:hypothetical protein
VRELSVFSHLLASGYYYFTFGLRFEMTLHFLLCVSELILVDDTIAPIHTRRLVAGDLHCHDFRHSDA